MSLALILAILSLHFVADFVCQSDWMAQGKSKRLLPLATHVLVYFVIFATITHLWAWCALNTALHFVIDYVTSRITSRLYKAGRVHDFFVVIGFDQLLHYICLFGTFAWMTPFSP